MIVKIWKINPKTGNYELSELYANCFIYINFDKKYINVSSDGSNNLDWQHIPFERIDCDSTNRHFAVYKKENT